MSCHKSLTTKLVSEENSSTALQTRSFPKAKRQSPLMTQPVISPAATCRRSWQSLQVGLIRKFLENAFLNCLGLFRKRRPMLSAQTRNLQIELKRSPKKSPCKNIRYLTAIHNDLKHRRKIVSK